MNSITVAGQLGRDAEVRFLSNGDPVASFSVADSQGKDKPTIWWNCSLFGKRAESLAQYLTKGQSVTVTGSVTEREWTDKEGMKRKSMDVRVNDIALQGGRKDDAGHAPAAQRPAQRQAPKDDGFGDSDIPF
jgi:single-strand DNA-binding protein